MRNLDGHKLYWHGDRVRRWLNGERVAPITIDMALTQACTYKCKYCYAQMQQNPSAMMSWDILLNFLIDCKSMGVKGISLVSDGESTCHPSWVNFVLNARLMGIDIAMGTNGYLMEKGDLVNVIPSLTYLRFNISAATRERYKQIHGVGDKEYSKVISNIKFAVEEKRHTNSKVTIGMQMVFIPELEDQIMPLVDLGQALGVDYLIIKHCTDDEKGSLGIDYDKYREERIIRLLQEAESKSTPTYQVAVKWSKILQGKEGRNYTSCYGPPLFLQISGSGIVAPCGSFFNNKYSRYHIGNLHKDRFLELWRSERYWEVMKSLTEGFNAKTMCACLCLQHRANEYLDVVKSSGKPLIAISTPPQHVNFI